MARVFDFSGFRLLRNSAAAVDREPELSAHDAHTKALAMGDWSQQELADLYRVEALLVQANIRIDTERGVTDEGDPWFVFCRADGEVFVHLSRFDGLYLLDSPGLDTPLRGNDFAALIDGFVKSVAERAGTGNVVQFRRGRSVDGVVRLHPAVMLAALVWSLYLASDQLMGVAEAAGAETFPVAVDDDADDGFEDDPELALSYLEERIEPAAQDNYAPDARPAPMQTAAREADAARMATEARGGWHSGHASAIAASLSAVAIAYGLHEQSLSQTRPAASNDKEAPESSALAETIAIHTVEISATRQDDARDGHAADAAQAELAIVPGVDLVLAEAQQASQLQDALYVLATLTPPPALDAPEQLPMPPQHVMRPAPASAAPSQPEAAGKAPAQEQKQAVKIVKADTQELVHFASAQLGQMSTYKVGGVSLAATFDIGTRLTKTAELVLSETAGLVLADAGSKAKGDTTLDTAHADGPAASTLLLLDALESAQPSSWMTQFNPYDAHAKSFIHSFLTRSADTVEMIQRDSTLIMIDMSAIDSPDDIYYSHGWVVDDRTVLTVIGHLQDFIEFGLATA